MLYTVPTLNKICFLTYLQVKIAVSYLHDLPDVHFPNWKTGILKNFSLNVIYVEGYDTTSMLENILTENYIINNHKTNENYTGVQCQHFSFKSAYQPIL